MIFQPYIKTLGAAAGSGCLAIAVPFLFSKQQNIFKHEKDFLSFCNPFSIVLMCRTEANP